jgi:8-oxo-dGTP diphosphatase
MKNLKLKGLWYSPWAPMKSSKIDKPQAVIRAAGALLWQYRDSDLQLALVHRERYDDWTLPKGKLKKSETWQQAALREVKEETGYDARVLDFAGALAYEAKGKPKVVRYWHMLAQGEPEEPDSEVDTVLWLPIDKAIERLHYPLEKALLEETIPPQNLINRENDRAKGLV